MTERRTDGDQDALVRLRGEARRLWRHLSRHPVWSGLLVLLLFAAGSAILASLQDGDGGRTTAPAVAGWGPPRPLYWCKRPSSCDGADHVVFNSYANATNYGDETTFVDAKPAGDLAAGGFRDVLRAEPGEIVLIRFYVNNAAWARRLGRAEGMAKGTEARAEVPLTAGTQHDIMGFISARNARPRVIWDVVTLPSDDPTVARFVFGSARWWTRHLPGGIRVSDALMEEGTPIGSWTLDGRFGDSFLDGGLLTFRVRIEAD